MQALDGQLFHDLSFPCHQKPVLLRIDMQQHRSASTCSSTACLA
jgi:hypothetical protein